MEKGILYGVSVGPGEGELITLKALRIIKECPVLAAPITPGGDQIALDIVSSVVDLADKEVLSLNFSMSHDAEVRAANHEETATVLRAQLNEGRSVALLNLGDVSLYASFNAIADLLCGEYVIEMIPGVPSFCAAASRMGISLTKMHSPLHLIPSSVLNEDALDYEGTRIFMKAGKQLTPLLEKLEDRGDLSKAYVVQNCGMEDERVFFGAEAKAAPTDYFSLVIVKE